MKMNMVCLGKCHKVWVFGDKLSVDYFDTEIVEMKNTEMYVEKFKVKLEKDTSYKGLWTLSFIMKEF